MRILITGGAGFIGSHLVEACVERGDEVVVLDDLSTGRRENLAAVAGRVELHEGDLRDRDLLRGSLVGVEGVLHHAAIPSVVRSLVEPHETASVNLMGTVLLLDECRRAAVGRLLFASSSAVYGEPARLPLAESDPVLPLSAYGAHKLAAEHLCRIASLAGGPDTASLRYFNVYGSRQRADSDYAAVIPKFREACARGEAPRIFGDGEQTRDFVHVRDVVEANLRLLDHPEPWQGEVFHVASGSSTRIIDLAQLIAAESGCDEDPVFAPPRPGDVRRSAASVRKLADALGWSPGISLEEGLRLELQA
ncbi:MAG: NAD-dependent epimerase/dehydratase family protein [Planctomycetota bacterium]